MYAHPTKDDLDRNRSIILYIKIGFIDGRSLKSTGSDGPVPASPPSKELVSLKPGLWGVSIDLKELWRRFRKKWRPIRSRVS
jgi:hypothetical protein